MNRHTYFIGIGGIGMSAIARILLQKGEKVSGCDSHKNSTVCALEKLGAQIGPLPPFVDRVVFSTAISDDHPELMAAKKQNIPLYHRSTMLKQIMEGKKGLLVTGCHGKTGTSALLYWTLKSLDPSFAVGGIIQQIDCNGAWGKGEYFIAEADESDGSFLVYDPYAAIVTNIDIDHLDHWNCSEELYAAYDQFMQRPKILIRGPVEVRHIRQKQDCLYFDYLDSKDICLKGVGEHLASNAACVFSLATQLGLSESEIRLRFETFPGVKRRAECIGEKNGILLFDDYAHHPAELTALFSSFRKAYPNRRLAALFEPHRFSRLQAFFDQFTAAMNLVDLPLITDVFSAGEKPIAGIDAENLIKGISGGCYLPFESLQERLSHHLKPGDLFITVGAGRVSEIGRKWIVK